VVSLERLDVDDAGSRREHAEAQLFHVIEWLEEGVVHSTHSTASWL